MVFAGLKRFVELNNDPERLDIERIHGLCCRRTGPDAPDGMYLVHAAGHIAALVRSVSFTEQTTATNGIWAFDPEAETWQKLDGEVYELDR